MSAPEPTGHAVESFIARWKNSGAAERANAQLFLSEFCDLLALPHPDPAQPDEKLSHPSLRKRSAVTARAGQG